MTDKCVQWCTRCGYRFTEKEIDEAKKSLTPLDRCPKCSDVGTPCDPKHDTTININWHELRILTMWADNWARKHCEDHSVKALTGIIGRLERQRPDMQHMPLTMSGELRGLKEHYGPENVQTSTKAHDKSFLIPINGPGANTRDDPLEEAKTAVQQANELLRTYTDPASPPDDVSRWLDDFGWLMAEPETSSE